MPSSGIKAVTTGTGCRSHAQPPPNTRLGGAGGRSASSPRCAPAAGDAAWKERACLPGAGGTALQATRKVLGAKGGKQGRGGDRPPARLSLGSESGRFWGRTWRRPSSDPRVPLAWMGAGSQGAPGGPGASRAGAWSRGTPPLPQLHLDSRKVQTLLRS